MSEKDQAGEQPVEPKRYRVKEVGAGAVWLAEQGQFATPDPALTYSEDDPIVKAAPWLFTEGVGATPDRRIIESVRIPEQATARPGEKRGRGNRGAR